MTNEILLVPRLGQRGIAFSVSARKNLQKHRLSLVIPDLDIVHVGIGARCLLLASVAVPGWELSGDLGDCERSLIRFLPGNNFAPSVQLTQSLPSLSRRDLGLGHGSGVMEWPDPNTRRPFPVEPEIHPCLLV